MADAPKGSVQASAELEREQLRWRSRVLQGLLWTSTLVFLSVGGLVLIQGLYGSEGSNSQSADP